MGRFSRVLESPPAVEYLQSARRPTLSAALERAGTDDEEVLTRLQAATDELELALSTVHLFADREAVHHAVERLARGFAVLLGSFPTIQQSVRADLDEQSARTSCILYRPTEYVSPSRNTTAT